MKKWISILLALAIVLGLCACGGGGAANTGGDAPQPQSPSLQAGFGRENITPEKPAGLGGYSDAETRTSGIVLDYIYTTCVAFKDGDQTILVFTIDICGLIDAQMDAIRVHVTTNTGIPGENIFIGATHTHSAPQVSGNADWKLQLHNACSIAAKAAIADLAPVKMETATATLENLNFVRHYLMNDGTYYGSNFGSEASGYKAHALEYPDRQLILLKLDREEKKDILMINWQAHPASAAREVDYNAVSADFVGPLRTKVENETGMYVAYYTGAAGNTNKDSRIESEKHNLNYKDFGEKIAEKVLENIPNLTVVEAAGIKTTKLAYNAEIDHSWDHMIKEANEVFNLWKTVGKEAGDNLGKAYGFTSSYQARAIRTRYDKPATEVRELRAFRIGPIGFTTGTYEMFSDHAEYVKENSPFDITFIITGCSGYIGNIAAYDYRSYEADTGMYARGVGEQLAEKYVELLKSIQ